MGYKMVIMVIKLLFDSTISTINPLGILENVCKLFKKNDYLQQKKSGFSR